MNDASVAIDFILGLLLIFGVRKVIPLCLVRTILGSVVYLAIALYGGDDATAAIQVALSGSLLGLLAGTPSSARIGLSATAAAGVLITTVLLLYNVTRIRVTLTPFSPRTRSRPSCKETSKGSGSLTT